MKVIINKTPTELPEGCKLSEALEKASIVQKGIAVAVNNTVIKKANYSSTTLKDGDNILVIKAFYGG